MSASAEFIEALFHRLTLRYGRAFLARWEAVPVDEVKADWRRELVNYAERPEAIEYALALMDPVEPPTAARFRELCASAPAPAFQAASEPKEPQRAAEIRRKYLRPVLHPLPGGSGLGLLGCTNGAACRCRRARLGLQPARSAGCAQAAGLAVLIVGGSGRPCAAGAGPGFRAPHRACVPGSQLWRACAWLSPEYRRPSCA